MKLILIKIVMGLLMCLEQPLFWLAIAGLIIWIIAYRFFMGRYKNTETLDIAEPEGMDKRNETSQMREAK